MENTNYNKLITEIINLSNNKYWNDAKLEWSCVDVDLNTEGICLCGHHLSNLYHIKNKLNGNKAIVGSSCVKKFENNDMDNYLSFINEYQKLINKQKKNGIEQSLPISLINKMYQYGRLNEIEYKFYKDIYKKLTLSDKQNQWKIRINNKISRYNIKT